MTDQTIEHRVLMIEFVIVHARFRCNQISDRLCVFASKNRVVKKELVTACCGIFIVELHKFDAISESVEGHLCALGDGNKLFFIIYFAIRAGKKCQGSQVASQCPLVLEVHGAETGHLGIEELSCVEHGLFFFA